MYVLIACHKTQFHRINCEQARRSHTYDVEIFKELNGSGHLCQFGQIKQTNKKTLKIAHLKPFNLESVFVCLSHRYSFPLATKAERSSGATSSMIKKLQHLFCTSINAWPYKGLLTAFHHPKVTLLLFLYAWYHFWDAPFGHTFYRKTCTFSLCTMH